MRSLAVVAGLLLLTGCAEGPSPAADPAGDPWFAERAVERGLTFTFHSGFAGRHLNPEVINGGAALFDADGDGDLDAYLVQGGSLVEPGGARAANALFLNDGRGRFAPATDAGDAGDRGYGAGVATGDFDADGDVDLYVTNVGANVLLRNDGDGRFTDVTDVAGVGDPGWGSSAAFADYDADGDLDLFVVNYFNWSLETERECYSPLGRLAYCNPTNYDSPARDVLYRNDGDGSFTDVSLEAGLDRAFGNGLGVVAADFDDDGRVDLFVANDQTPNQLWRNLGDGRFRDEALLRGCALDEHGRTKAGMGVVARDHDDDGDLDLIVVNLEGETDSFFRNDGGTFSDQTGRVGLTSVSRGFTRFGLGWQDFDNDGRLDLYQANGRVAESVESVTDDPYAEINVLWRGLPDGRYAEVLPRGGTARPLVHTSRGAAFGDVDDDGGVDVLVVNRDGPAYLLLNRVADRGAWVRFRVLDADGRDALGARLTLEVDGRRLRRDVHTAYSIMSANDPRVHVGLGAATRASDVRVRWVDGVVESFDDVEAGRTVVLRRGEGRAP